MLNGGKQAHQQTLGCLATKAINLIKCHNDNKCRGIYLAGGAFWQIRRRSDDLILCWMCVLQLCPSLCLQAPEIHNQTHGPPKSALHKQRLTCAPSLRCSGWTCWGIGGFLWAVRGAEADPLQEDISRIGLRSARLVEPGRPGRCYKLGVIKSDTGCRTCTSWTRAPPPHPWLLSHWWWRFFYLSHFSPVKSGKWQHVICSGSDVSQPTNARLIPDW